MARTEVIDGEIDATAAQFGQPLDHRRSALDQHPLGELKGERGRRQAGVVERCEHGLGEPGRADLPRREVDRNADGPAGAVPGGCLLARLAQHPVAERHDKARVFRDVKKLRRVHRLASTRPADQRFHTGDLRSGEVHDRLKVKSQFPLRNRPPQVAGQLQPADDIRMHVRGEDLHPAATGLLGAGHRHIRVAQQVAGFLVISEGHADTRSQRDIPVRDAERLGGDGPAQPFGDIHDLLRAVGLLDQHRELVAAPPGHGVARRDRSAEPACGLSQQQVTGAVPDRVVHAGKAVQVKEDGPGHGRLLARGLPFGRGLHRGAENVLRPLLEVRAVRQAGQPVVESQVRHLAAQCHLIADVPGSDEQLVGLARVPVPRRGGLDVPPGPVGRPHPARISLRCRGTAGCRASVPDPAWQVLRMHQIGECHPVQFFRRVTVLGDGSAGVPDRAVEITDKHDVGNALGKLAELAARLLPGNSHRPLPDQQPRDPGGQREHGDAARDGNGWPGRRPAGQRRRDDHQGRGRCRERGDQRRQARLPCLAVAFEQAHTGHRAVLGEPQPARVDQWRRAKQAERGELHELRPRPRTCGVDLGSDRKRVTHGHGKQGEEGREPAPARNRHVRQDHAEHGQVS